MDFDKQCEQLHWNHYDRGRRAWHRKRFSIGLRGMSISATAVSLPTARTGPSPTPFACLTIRKPYGFMGDYSLTFTSTLQVLAGANNINTLFNNIAAGKSLTFGNVTADSIGASRSWTFDGAGETIISGNFTTSTAFGVPIIKTGDGILQLNGTASNFNQASQNIDIDRGTFRLGASGVIPDGAGFGGVLLSPELANGDTAIFDLNGKTETINGLTMNTNGTAIIDNT